MNISRSRSDVIKTIFGFVDNSLKMLISERGKDSENFANRIAVKVIWDKLEGRRIAELAKIKYLCGTKFKGNDKGQTTNTGNK